MPELTQDNIDQLKADLQEWFNDYEKDGKDEEGEWASQLKEVFSAAYGADWIDALI